MSKFDFLNGYIFKQEDEKATSSKHSFYLLEKNDLKEAQDRLGFEFPKEISLFYNKIGYGFLCNESDDMIDRFMDPGSVADFILCEGVFETNEPFEYYEKNFLPFFEISEDSFIALDLDSENEKGECAVYYFDSKIADSLEEFLRKMDEKTDYYLKY
jgi:hypothetical protein